MYLNAKVSNNHIKNWFIQTIIVNIREIVVKHHKFETKNTEKLFYIDHRNALILSTHIALKNYQLI